MIVYGIASTIWIGGARSSQGCTTSRPSSTSPDQHMITTTAAVNCSSSGTNGSGGAVTNAAEIPSSSGSVARLLPVERQDVGGLVERPADEPAEHERSDRVEAVLEARRDAEVAAAAAQAPRTARRSRSSLHVRVRPSAVTRSTDSRLSHESPKRRVSHPKPPPSVRPAMPVVEMTPPGVARPTRLGRVRRSAPQVVPPPRAGRPAAGVDLDRRSSATGRPRSRRRTCPCPPRCGRRPGPRRGCRARGRTATAAATSAGVVAPRDRRPDACRSWRSRRRGARRSRRRRGRRSILRTPCGASRWRCRAGSWDLPFVRCFRYADPRAPPTPCHQSAGSRGTVTTPTGRPDTSSDRAARPRARTARSRRHTHGSE